MPPPLLTLSLCRCASSTAGLQPKTRVEHPCLPSRARLTARPRAAGRRRPGRSWPRPAPSGGQPRKARAAVGPETKRPPERPAAVRPAGKAARPVSEQPPVRKPRSVRPERRERPARRERTEQRSRPEQSRPDRAERPTPLVPAEISVPGPPATGSGDFAALGLPPGLVASLAESGITTPFPIQSATIPEALRGQNVLGRAQTGSGKTLAFGLPMLARWPTTPRRRGRAAPRPRARPDPRAGHAGRRRADPAGPRHRV